MKHDLEPQGRKRVVGRYPVFHSWGFCWVISMLRHTGFATS